MTMKPQPQIKVRLERPHYLDGVRKPAGAIIRLPKSSAEFLVLHGLARIVGPR